MNRGVKRRGCGPVCGPVLWCLGGGGAANGEGLVLRPKSVWSADGSVAADMCGVCLAAWIELRECLVQVTIVV